MKTKQEYRIYTWSEERGLWEYLQSTMAWSAKQAKAYAIHYLPTFGRMETATPAQADALQAMGLAYGVPSTPPAGYSA